MAKKKLHKKHKKVATTVISVVNSICLAVATIMMVVGGLLQWGQTFLRLTILPTFFIMVSKGYGMKAISMAQIAIVTDNYLGALSQAGLIIFIIGVVLSNICSLGIIGICCKKGFILVLYIVLASILIFAIMIVIIIFLVKKSQMESNLVETLRSTLVNKYKFRNDVNSKTSIDFSGIIDLIQMRGHCCGSKSGYDYKPIATKDAIPFSCCVMNETAPFTPLYKDCTSWPNSVNSYYDNGCSAFIWIFIKKFSEYAYYTLIGLGLILLLLITTVIIILRCCGKSEYKMPGSLILM